MAKRRFYHLINVARQALNRHAARECQAALGITAVQLGALFVIADQPDCTQRELGRTLALGESAVTGLVGRLVEQELVTRGRGEDARVRTLRLSPKARGLLGRAAPLMKRFNDELTEGFARHELDLVERFLRGIVERCGESEVVG